MNKLKSFVLKGIVRKCGSYGKLYSEIKENPSKFERFGISAFLYEVNCNTEETMLLLVEILTEMMGTDEGIHYGYNDPNEETGTDSGKYYVFVDC